MRLIPHSRGGMLWRFAVAAVLVIGFAASTTAVAGLLQVRQITQYIDATPAIKALPSVSVPNPGSAQTILLVGSDHRAHTPLKDVNTDTMMLVRLDPSSQTINLVSIPRDLKVQIPEGGAVVTGKLNAAYFYGGPGLLIKILQEQVFQGLKVNHVVDVGFGGFEQMINAIGCVYTDVDHRYYNNTAVTDYSSIDLQPGYQKLCGADALSFVRFRHTDSDIVRNARQQDFIRWAKAQFSQDQIITQESRLLKIFGNNALDRPQPAHHRRHHQPVRPGRVLGRPLDQADPVPGVPLPCYSGPVQANSRTAAAVPACYVTADSGAEQSAFHAFMTPTTAPPASTSPGPSAGAASAGGNAGAGGKARAGGKGHGGGGGGGVPGLTSDVSDGVAQAKALGALGIPVYFPKLIATGSNYCSDHTSLCPVERGADRRGLSARLSAARPARRRPLRLPDDARDQPGARRVLRRSGQHLAEPAHPEQPERARSSWAASELLLYANGSKLSLVAWRTPQGVYWVSNTLTDSIPNSSWSRSPRR